MLGSFTRESPEGYRRFVLCLQEFNIITIKLTNIFSQAFNLTPAKVLCNLKCRDVGIKIEQPLKMI